MPLGKVFDAREGQVLFSPVSNYYQGKAIRADIGLREKQGEALQQEIDANLPERKIKAEEDRVDLQREQEDRLKEVWDAEKDDRKKEEFIGTLDVAEATYQNTIAAGGSEEEANIASYNALLDEADRLNGAGTREEAERGLAEQGFSPEMWSQEGIIKIRSTLGIRPAPPANPVTVAAGADLVDPVTGKVIHSTPKTFAPGSGDKPTFDPPNAAEIDAALKIVKRELDLDSSYHTDAAMWLANEVRNIQERSEESYDVAVAMALAKMKSKLGEEPDLLSGRDDTLTYSTETLGANEYLVRGEVWVKESDGRIHRKNP